MLSLVLMIGKLVYSVLEPQTQERTSNKRCILTEEGRQKLLKVIQDQNDSELARIASLDRGIVKKIREANKAVTYSSLDRLFSSLSLDLEDKDFQKLKIIPGSVGHKLPESISQNKSSIIEKIQTEKFINALYELDYCSQRNSFKQAITHVKPAATFVIHGRPNYGQRWLVNLLRYEVPYYTNSWQKSIYIKPHRKDIDVIWQTLAQELKTNSSPQAVAQELYLHWKTRTVILVIHDVDLIAGSCLKQFMDELWQPLVAKAKIDKELQCPYRILLFLVDNKNSYLELQKSLSLLTEIDINRPHLPFLLNELEPFNRNLIETWVGVQEQLLSPLWKSPVLMEQVMCEIVERDNQPIFVFRDICQCFEFEWYEIERGLAL